MRKNNSITLSFNQCRKVTVNYLAHILIIQKQYLDDTEKAHLKGVLNNFSSPKALEAIIKKFDKSWPTDVKWDAL